MVQKVGQFVFMLHSHLPYYRMAGMWPFGEECLYECMEETYVPLLNMISELYDEGSKEVKIVKARENQSKEVKNLPVSAL